MKILGKIVLGLLDSGASRSVMSLKCWEYFALLGVKKETETETNISAADGRRIEIYGKVKLPIELEGRVKVMEILIVPVLSCDLVLGIDFWEKMRIVPNLSINSWSFSDESCMAMSKETAKLISQGDLTTQENEELERLVNHWKLGKT